MPKTSKTSSAEANIDVPEITAEEMKRGVVGKYYFEVMQGCNIVRIDEEVARHFPNEKAVNDALRMLVQLGKIIAPAEIGHKQDKPSKTKKTA